MKAAGSAVQTQLERRSLRTCLPAPHCEASLCKWGMEWSGRRRHGGQGRRPHWRPITGSGTVRPGPGFTVRFALFTWTSALLSRHEVTPKIHRRTSMAYVTWKLVFLYDNNKSIYLNKYPYTMKGLCRRIACCACQTLQRAPSIAAVVSKDAM